jgi:hypothetical protein
MKTSRARAIIIAVAAAVALAAGGAAASQPAHASAQTGFRAVASSPGTWVHA